MRLPLAPEPGRVEHAARAPALAASLSVRRLARLPRQLCWIIGFSGFPQAQRERREFPRGRHARQLLAHPAGEESRDRTLATRPGRVVAVVAALLKIAFTRRW